MTDTTQPLLSLISIFPPWLPWLYTFWVPAFAVPDMLTTRRFALLDIAISGDAGKHEFNRILKWMLRRLGVDRAIMYYYPVEVLLMLFLPFILGYGFALLTLPFVPILRIFPWVDFLEELIQAVFMLMMALIVLNNYLLGNRLRMQLTASSS